MPTECVLPDLGDNIESADVANVLVAVGDAVTVDQDLIEVETGKAAMPVPSPVAGVVKEIRVNAGDQVAVGAVFVVVEEEGASSAPAPASVEAAPAPASVEAAPAPAPAANAEVTVALPDLGDGIKEADVVSVLVAVGDDVADGQDIIEVETGKAAMPVPSSAAGKVIAIHAEPGAKLAVGAPVIVVAASDGAASAPAPVAAPAPAPAATPAPAPAAEQPAAAPVQPAAANDGTVRAIPASPSVRRFAREIGIDVADVSGTGAKGRISIEDVKAYSKSLNKGGGRAATGGGVAPASKPLPDFTAFGPVTEEVMNTVRKVTAEHMSFCWNTIPHVTNFDKSDITDLEAARKTLQKRVEAQGGGKLTVTAVLVKVCAIALKKFKAFNSSIDPAAGKVFYKDYVNIGIAVDTPRGLVVPVIKDADKKNIIELTADLGAISKKARDGKITPKDMQGGTFTISNLGGIGGTGFTPIVNWPEVAILGVARGEQEPVWDGAQFQPRLRMPLSLSYDHRIIDGADAARFLRWICEALENPLLIPLEG